MKFRWHYFYSILFILIPCIILTIYLRLWILTPIGVFAVMVGSWFPDTDFLFKKLDHRHVLTHSLFMPFLFYIFCTGYIGLQLLCAFSAYGIGLHLLCDVHLRSYKQKGTYTLKFFRWYNPFKLKWQVVGLSGRQTTIVFIASFFISITFVAWTLWRVVL